MNKDFASRFSVAFHPRDNLGLKYVYAVNSRRSGGLSVGINVSPNKACHYRCLYCQVQGLKRGKAPDFDAALLKTELRSFLSEALHDSGALPIRDIAISGDGEPTSLRDFEGLIGLIRQVLDGLGILGSLKVVLITNGTLLHLPGVQRGLELLGSIKGEVWFKLDVASSEGLRLVNGTGVSPLRLYENLKLAAQPCPVWVHTL
jgi:wyosine [tRNA(Phe)-imidazoG37] synthetase (radical SAM superfamily)